MCATAHSSAAFVWTFDRVSCGPPYTCVDMNGVELAKLQLYLLSRFCILPTLWMLPQRRGSMVLRRTTQFTCWRITVSTHLAAILANAIQGVSCPDRKRSRVWPSQEVPQSEAVRRSRSFGNCRGMQIEPRTRKNVAIRSWRRTVGEHAAQRHEREERLFWGSRGSYAGADWPIRKADCEG